MLRERPNLPDEGPSGIGPDGPAAASDKAVKSDARGPICVVDDDDWVCDSLVAALDAHGFLVSAFGSGARFLADKRCDETKCLIIDQHMPDMDGLDVIAALRHDGLVPPAILITGRLDGVIAQRAGELGVRAILEKPFRLAKLIALVHEAVDRRD
jgi:two-component system, LuxR family, response regulator FixJ